MRQSASLRLRLILGAAAWIAVALLAGGIVLMELFQNHVERQLRTEVANHLEQLLAGLEAAPDGSVDVIRPLSDPRFHKPYSGLYWQVDAPDQAGLLRSRSLWDFVLSLPADELNFTEWHWHPVVGPSGQSLLAMERSVDLPAAGRLRVSAAIDVADMEAVTTSFGRILALSFAALGCGLLAAAAAPVVLALRPLRRMRRALAHIRSGSASRLEGDFPLEIQPLIDDLNALLAHDAAMIERARVQAGNLAHGLKTPLAILANEASALERRGSGDEAEVIRQEVARMQAQVDYQLAQARAAAARQLPGARCKLVACVDGVRRALVRLHAERNLIIEMTIPEDAYFRGQREDCEEIFGNLLDNACKWAGSRVAVTGRVKGEQLSVTIDDDGPGLSADQRVAVFERGRRLDEAVPGSGLGLSIVRDLVEIYRGEIHLIESPLGGLRVELLLPAARSGAAGVLDHKA